MIVDANQVTLREITADTVISIIRLSVAENQKQFVATDAVSLAQAWFVPEAWYRGIYLGLGFRHTGRMDGVEVILEIPLD